MQRRWPGKFWQDPLAANRPHNHRKKCGECNRPPLMSTPHTSVARQLKQTLHLWVLSVRDMLASAGPVLLLAIGLLGAAYWWLDPQPPRTVTLAAGPAGSVYADFGHRYAQALARDGIRVQLLSTDGPAGNLQALREGRADVAFVRGGSGGMNGNSKSKAGIMSLGALFYEPLWLFYRPAALAQAASNPTKEAAPDARLTSLTQLRGLRVNLDQAGSGVPDLMSRLLQANGLAIDTLITKEMAPQAAAEALQAGQLDVMVLVTAPESPVVQRLLQDPGIALAELPQADALARRFPFLQTVALPRCMVDLARDLPPDDIGPQEGEEVGRA